MLKLQHLSLQTGRLMRLALVFVLSGTLLQAAQSAVRAADGQPWMDASLPPEKRAELLLAAMSQDEKLAMLYGSSIGSGGYVGHVPGISRLGIPALNLQDGPAGVAGNALGVTAFPAPITVAASWDTDLMQRYGVAMAEEERDKGANIQLGPMMNIDRVPLAGRNFEGYGEDPYLSGQMAAATIRGIQSTGVIATAKHFIDNDQEYQRFTISSEIDARTQHEIYLPPFKASVDAGVGAVMCSYNRINGVYACENPDTQNMLLKGELGFKGWIMSDWGATHSTAESALGGLDMEMPGGVNYVKLKDALNAKQVPSAQVDDKVLRILTAMFRAKLFDHGTTGTFGADVQSEAHKQFAREAAAQGMVLLKNDGAVLPFEADKIHSLAVFGTAADEQPLIVGGGSARVTPPYSVSPLQGITARAGQAIAVRYFTPNNAIGHPIPAAALSQKAGGAAGLQVQYFNTPDLSGSAVASGTAATIDFDWQGQPPAAGVNASGWSARWSGVLTGNGSGRYNLALSGNGRSRLYIDDKLVIDNWGDQPQPSMLVRRRLTPGQAYAIRVEYAAGGQADALHFTWSTPTDDPNQEAASVAAGTDAAVVVVGVGSSEGVDRADLNLADAALVEAVSKANPHTVVVVYNPAQTLLPWADQVPAILIGWVPGQEAGNALADVLFGDVDPAGKLPMTYARDAKDYPADTPEAYPGLNGQVLYSEGLRVGYRHFDSRKIAPLFPFGHGLSYTTFKYSNLVVIPAVTDKGGGVTIGVKLTNTGQRAGAEVAQLYLGLPPESGEPPLQLKGFQKVSLQPGESQQVAFTLAPQDYSFWSAGLNGWVAYPGTYQVLIGASSRDIRQSGNFEVQISPLAGTVLQAEEAALAGDAVLAKDPAGFTGSGYVGGFQKPGAAVSFKLDGGMGGSRNIFLRYSSTLRPGEQNKPRTLSLYVNGTRQHQIKLPNLANWEMWDFESENVMLTAGQNTVTYQFDAGDNGDVHLDALIVSPATAAGSDTNNWIVVALIVLAVLVLVGLFVLRRRSAKE